MTRATAETVVKALRMASGALNESVHVVKASVSQEAFEDYRRRTAEVMAALYLDLIKPIVREHPDLDPGLEVPDDRR